jgi:hypothetical protein
VEGSDQWEIEASLVTVDYAGSSAEIDGGHAEACLLLNSMKYRLKKQVFGCEFEAEKSTIFAYILFTFSYVVGC